jgi:hypothetical protein
MRPQRWRFACFLNQCRSLWDQPTASVGLNEGQMRNLTGYLVACSGAEQAAVRTAVCISQPFLCRDDRVDRAHVRGDTPIGIGIAPRDLGGNGAASGSPIGIVHAGENILDRTIEEIAGAIPRFGLFD